MDKPAAGMGQFWILLKKESRLVHLQKVLITITLAIDVLNNFI